MKVYLTLLVTASVLFCNAQSDNRHYKQAIALAHDRKLEKAFSEINLALRDEPDNIEILVFKADCYAAMGQLSTAHVLLSDIMEKFPKSYHPYGLRGFIYYNTRDYDASIDDFTYALNLEIPDSIRVGLLINRGETYRMMRKFELAYKDLTQAHQLDSSSLAVLNNLAIVSDGLGMGDTSIWYLEKIIKVDSNQIEGLANLGFKYQLKGEYVKSNSYYDKVSAKDPNNPYPFTNRAYNYYKLGQLDLALKQVNKGIEIYPSNSYAFRNRALIYIAKEKKDLACADLQKAIVLGFTENYGPEVEELKSANCGYGR